MLLTPDGEVQELIRMRALRCSPPGSAILRATRPQRKPAEPENRFIRLRFGPCPPSLRRLESTNA